MAQPTSIINHPSVMKTAFDRSNTVVPDHNVDIAGTAVAVHDATNFDLSETTDGSNNPIHYVQLNIQNADVYVTEDGGTPSATAGYKLKQDHIGIVPRQRAFNMKMIRTAATARLNLTPLMQGGSY